MNIRQILKHSGKLMLVAGLLMNMHGSFAALTDISSSPLVTSASSSVKPNLLFVLDDSGSMGWDYLPDWANDTDPFSSNAYTSMPELFRNAGFNSIAYNPAITYTPPTYYNADGTTNTSTYPSMTSANSSAWTAVKNDGYGVQATGTSNLVGSAYFYTFISGEYCSDEHMRNCNVQSAANSAYPYAAGLRWCTSTALTTCQALWYSGNYTYPRYPKRATATIRISGSSSTSVSGVTINSKQIMSAGAAASTSYATLASNIVTAINNCTSAISGSCTIAGYSASYTTTSSGGGRATITITAPGSLGAITYTPAVTQSGTMTITPAAFSGYAPGSILRTDIVSSTSSYPYPNTISKATSRTDCSGTTCTYDEEMTNYANWYAYYRTRMQMMKTSASISFANLNNNYRVGYASLNNNTGSDFQNMTDFSNAQKHNWDVKLFAADTGNSTPLRYSLAQAGKLYTGKLTTLNGISVTDPIQYSCQQNFTILSTDGYWNGGAGTKIDGTAVGNQDSAEPRPFNDGGSVTYTKTTAQVLQSQTQINRSTSQLQKRIKQIQSSTSNLQSQTSQLQTRSSHLQASTSQLQQVNWTLEKQVSSLQKRTSSLQKSTGQLQKRTSSNSGGSWSPWSDVSSCKWDTSGSSRTQCQYNWGAFSNVSSCDRSYNTDTSNGTTWSGNGTDCQYTSFSAWSNTSACSAQAQDPTDPYNTGTATECQTVVTSAYTPVASCTATTTPDGSGNTTQCRYTAGTANNVASCTAIAQSASPNYTVATAVTCQYSAYSAFSDVASCTPLAQDLSSPHTVAVATQCAYGNPSAWTGTASCTATDTSTFASATATECQTAITSPYSNVGSCTTSSIPDGSGNTTQCQYTAYTAYANASSCTPVSPSASSPYTVGNAVQCQETDTGWVGVSSCSPSASGGQTVTCQTATTGPTPVASCTAASAAVGNNFTQTTCATTTISSPAPVASCTAVAPSASNNYVTTNCTNNNSTSTVSSCTAASPTAANAYTTVSCSSPTSSGGYSDTLADVAEYYYTTDLRTSTLANCTSGSSGETLCSAVASDPYNNVPTTGQDGNSAQHMTTFTVGLGIPGYMQFNSNYLAATSGDYYDVKAGSLTDTAAGICPWQNSGACNWPQPSSDSQANIDDLWHAAVNGRGTYFSAGNPALLITGLSNALAGIATRTGTAAAATTSNPNVTSGDNFLFSSTFTTQSWDGELVRQQLDLSTGVPLTAIDWAAQEKLDNKTYSSRTIYTFDAATSNKLKAFEWSGLTSTQQAYFQSAHIASLTQFCSTGITCLSSGDQADAAGENLVNFVRGQRSLEGGLTDTSKFYRARSHVLGDIVNAEAVYVKGTLFTYADFGFSSYATTVSSRQGMVYVAANDGMLHAFYAADATGITGGDEAWAYVPTAVMSNLYKLADKNYANLHQYYVDGTPVVGDICTSSCSSSSAVWKTILVGGLNGGGRGYYALDITNPASPKALWEFTDTNLGYSYGNPKITKLANGTWVVIFTSGYNNVSPGDGVGRLFILNAATGALVTSINSSGTISTGYGDSSSPSGLGKISARVVDPGTDNTVTDVYSGDMYGNVWRFDVNNTTGASGFDAQLLAVLKDASGNRQPITTKPEVGVVNTHKVVFVGTGRYLGTSDLSDTHTQSFYAIKDSGDTTTFNTPRTPANNFVQQTLTSVTCPTGTSSGVCTTGQAVRTGTDNAVDFGTQNGWYIDFPDSGERDNTDPILALGTLGFNTNVPNSTACNIGGYSYRYFLDFRTGAPISTANGVVSSKLGNALATRPVYVRLPNNTVIDLTRLSDGTTVVSDPPIGNGSSTTRRTSWRELISE